MLSQFLSSYIPEPLHPSRRDHQGAATLHKTAKGHTNSGTAVATETLRASEATRRLDSWVHSEPREQQARSVILKDRKNLRQRTWRR